MALGISRRYIGPVTLLFAVGQGLYAGYGYIEHQRIAQSGVLADGHIVEMRIDRNRQGSGVDAKARVSFAVAGQPPAVRTTEVPVAYAENLQQQGKSDVPVQVRYRAANPDSFEIVGESTPWARHAIMAGFLALFGLLLTLRGARA